MELTKETVQKQLDERILPFWLSLEDKAQGGFYAKVAADLSIDKQADKSAILMTRYLWALSAAYPVSETKGLLEAADQVYQFIVDYLLDEDQQGLFWSVSYDGQAKVTQKHIYVQSFAIYAFSEYYKVSQKESSLKLAIDLFNLIESKAYLADDSGYHEEFTSDWQPHSATLMGPKGEATYYSTNALLHLLEAYTNLYQVYPDSRLSKRITHLLALFKEYIVSEEGHCYTEFHRDWTPLNSDISYAHDIETAWLLYRSLEVLEKTNDSDYVALVQRIVQSVLEEGLDDQGIILDHYHSGQKSQIKQWWSLAESVIGFYDAFSRTKEVQFKRLAQSHWEFIQAHLMIPGQLSEWLPHVDESGQVVETKSTSLSDGWKGPYHTVRMYVEMLGRLS